MKYPTVKIVWREFGRIEQHIKVERLSNGFLLGRTFFASEESMIKHLAEAMKTPDAYFEPPQYND
jgi:hypothetical protein